MHLTIMLNGYFEILFQLQWSNDASFFLHFWPTELSINLSSKYNLAIGITTFKKITERPQNMWNGTNGLIDKISINGQTAIV